MLRQRQARQVLGAMGPQLLDELYFPGAVCRRVRARWSV